jgi:hypothetical protein
VNVTSVPFWTGVPAPGLLVLPPGVVVPPFVPPLVGGGVGVAVVPCSITVAMISVDPFAGIVVAAGNSVMTLPDGASSGTLSQAAANERAAAAVRRAESAAMRRARGACCSTI